jgi:hypothetical protein
MGMEENHSENSPANRLRQLSDALVELRDVLTEVSLHLNDWLTERPSAERSELLSDVKQYLEQMGKVRMKPRE